jgi:hypothetical protein
MSGPLDDHLKEVGNPESTGGELPPVPPPVPVVGP